MPDFSVFATIKPISRGNTLFCGVPGVPGVPATKYPQRPAISEYAAHRTPATIPGVPGVPTDNAEAAKPSWNTWNTGDTERCSAGNTNETATGTPRTPGTPENNVNLRQTALQAEHDTVLADVKRTLTAIKARRAKDAVTLTDGRKMHTWPAGGLAGNPGVALAWMDAARRQGAVLVADGDTLHLVEPKNGISAGVLADLYREVVGIVAALRSENYARTGDAVAAEAAP